MGLVDNATIRPTLCDQLPNIFCCVACMCRLFGQDGCFKDLLSPDLCL